MNGTPNLLQVISFKNKEHINRISNFIYLTSYIHTHIMYI